MSYSVSLEPVRTLIEEYWDVLRRIPAITESGMIIGPFVAFDQMKAEHFLRIKDYLPNVPDYELHLVLDYYPLSPKEQYLLRDFQAYTRIEILFDHHLSVNTQFSNPNLKYPTLNVNFYSNSFEEDSELPSTSRQFLTGSEKETFTEKFLTELFKALKKAGSQNVAELANSLIYGDFYTMDDEANGLWFGISGRDDTINENLCFSVGFKEVPASELFTIFETIVQQLGAIKRCRAQIYGDKEKVETFFTCIPTAVKFISLSSTGHASGTQLAIQALSKKVREEYVRSANTLLRKAVIPNDRLEVLLEQAEDLNSQLFSVKWDTLAQWKLFHEKNLQATNPEIFNECFIELAKAVDHKTYLFVELGDFEYPRILPKKKILEDIRMKLGKNLKLCNF